MPNSPWNSNNSNSSSLKIEFKQPEAKLQNPKIFQETENTNINLNVSTDQIRGSIPQVISNNMNNPNNKININPLFTPPTKQNPNNEPVINASAAKSNIFGKENNSNSNLAFGKANSITCSNQSNNTSSCYIPSTPASQPNNTFVSTGNTNQPNNSNNTGFNSPSKSPTKLNPKNEPIVNFPVNNSNIFDKGNQTHSTISWGSSFSNSVSQQNNHQNQNKSNIFSVDGNANSLVNKSNTNSFFTPPAKQNPNNTSGFNFNAPPKNNASNGNSTNSNSVFSKNSPTNQTSNASVWGSSSSISSTQPYPSSNLTNPHNNFDSSTFTPSPKSSPNNELVFNFPAGNSTMFGSRNNSPSISNNTSTIDKPSNSFSQPNNQSGFRFPSSNNSNSSIWDRANNVTSSNSKSLWTTPNNSDNTVNKTNMKPTCFTTSKPSQNTKVSGIFIPPSSNQPNKQNDNPFAPANTTNS